MKCQLLYFPVALCLTACGCSAGKDAPLPQIPVGQIEKDAEVALVDAKGHAVYNEGEIQILERNYSGTHATFVLNAGSINVGRLVPAAIEGLQSEIRPQEAQIDTIPFKLRLEYEWVRGEWRLRQLDNLTLEEWQRM